jgi:organic hydroperoxide reductase OsmC/OhrA
MAAVMPVGRLVNGLDMDELEDIAQEVRRDPGRGQVEFRARTEWKGRTRSRTMIDSYTVGGWQVHRHFTIDADQPFELQGRNTAPNPQELLMAALNACLTVAYVTQAALRGVTLEAVHIETAGSLDLRGVLGLDPSIRPGFGTLHYVARLRGFGTLEQFREIHEAVVRTSPNVFNLAEPVTIDARLIVE